MSNKPLYCYKLDKNTGTISQIIIKEYEDKDSGLQYSKGYYRYVNNHILYYVYKVDLDKFKNYKVYTFNPNIEYATKIIHDGIFKKYNKALTDMNNFLNILNNMNYLESKEDELQNE